MWISAPSRIATPIAGRYHHNGTDNRSSNRKLPDVAGAPGDGCSLTGAEGSLARRARPRRCSPARTAHLIAARVSGRGAPHPAGPCTPGALLRASGRCRGRPEVHGRRRPPARRARGRRHRRRDRAADGLRRVRTSAVRARRTHRAVDRQCTGHCRRRIPGRDPGVRDQPRSPRGTAAAPRRPDRAARLAEGRARAVRRGGGAARLRARDGRARVHGRTRAAGRRRGALVARRNRLAVATEQALDEPRGGGALALDQREDSVDDILDIGPYDGDDLDPEATDASGIVDFGAVQVPVPPRGTVAVEPTANGRMQAVHVALPEGRLSVSALAAPKSSKLWPDLAREIDTSLREGGATVRSYPGPWGRELHANSGGAKSVFIGVDGPRWMLYGVATGPANHAETLDAELRRMLRATVVVRGRAPYPVRTVLPLVVPEHLAEAMAAAAAAKAEAEAAQAQE